MNTEFAVCIVIKDRSERADAKSMVQQIGYAAVACASLDELVHVYKPNEPGCVIACYDAVYPDGVDAFMVMADRDAHLPVIAVAERGDVLTVVNAMRGGAVDFIERPVEPQRLTAALQRAHEVDSAWRARRARRVELQVRMKRLTPRETEVMHLVASGMANKQIAAALSRSPRTVELHRAHAMKKLEAGSLAALVTLVRDYEQHVGIHADSELPRRDSRG